jgi:hypothetical protein
MPVCPRSDRSTYAGSSLSAFSRSTRSSRSFFSVSISILLLAPRGVGEVLLRGNEVADEDQRRDEGDAGGDEEREVGRRALRPGDDDLLLLHVHPLA